MAKASRSNNKGAHSGEVADKGAAKAMRKSRKRRISDGGGAQKKETEAAVAGRHLRKECIFLKCAAACRVASHSAHVIGRPPVGEAGKGSPTAKEGKTKKKKKAKLTIWEKYEQHKQFVQEMKEEAAAIEAQELAEAAAKAANKGMAHSSAVLLITICGIGRHASQSGLSGCANRAWRGRWI